jgi:leucine dehydrogenase
MVFSDADFDDHEQVVFASDPATGLKAIIAIHSTKPGPAAGGCRILAYADDRAALTDVRRLSRGMSMKTAMAGLPLGGGKSVIIADPRRKSPALLRAMGRAIDTLGGRYVTAEDVGTCAADLV